MVKWRMFSLCIIYVTAVILRGKNQKIPRFEVVTWWIGRSTVNEVVANHQWSNIRGPAIFWGIACFQDAHRCDKAKCILKYPNVSQI